MNRTNTKSGDLVPEFFDRQQASDQYRSLKEMTRPLDLMAADYLNREVHGDCLTVGGVWEFFEWRDHLRSLTVLDLSQKMLSAYCPTGARAVVGDLYSHEFAPASFDSIVFPLMLHHTPQGNWGESEARVEEAMRRARGWLKPEGRIFIVEYCPHPVWNVLQRLLLPLTRRWLRAFKQPMVVMYAREFYERTLRSEFGSCDARRIAPEGFDYWAWYPIFMSISWLRMPFALYPKMHIFTAPR